MDTIEDVASSALCGVMEAALIDQGVSPEFAKILAERACKPVVKKGTNVVKKKVKKKVGNYQRRFGKNLEALKKKHPRTSNSTLMKRAHRQTRKEMKQ